jgi:photosynthetic reaction center cytochrome c subunit
LRLPPRARLAAGCSELAAPDRLLRLSDSGHLRKRVVATLFGSVFVVMASAQGPVASPDKTSSQVFKNIKVFNNIPSDQLIPSMQFISAGLGVQCEYCHVERAFERDDKKPKQIARRMIQMTIALNEQNFEGKQIVSCYSCHRGHPKPISIPVIPDTPLPFARSPELQTASGDLPKADEVVRRYAQTLGGRDQITRLTSISAKGTLEAGPAKFPIEVLKAKPNRVSISIYYPQGASVSNFDGTLGWILFPGRPLRAMDSSELDASTMDGALPFTSDLKSLFPDLETVRREQIGDQETLVLQATRPNLPPIEFYFDRSTGLLVRLVRYARSPLGLLPTRIDFSDYREVSGVKLPFHWNSATPLGRFAVQIASITVNLPMTHDTFSKPTSASDQAPSGH